MARFVFPTPLMSPSFSPGSGDIAPEVLAAQARPALPCPGGELDALLQSLAERMQPLLGTARPVYFLGSSASGLMEAAVRNLVEGTLLVSVGGPAGERWARVAAGCGRTVERLEVDWGETLSAEKLAAALQAQPYPAVALTHHETATGTLNPVAEWAEAVRQASPDTLILVDAASSLGGLPVEMDAWGADFVLGVSQHALNVPPGLGIFSVSARALERAAQVAGRGWYFDLLTLERQRLRDQTQDCPPLGLLYALDVQLDRMQAEGLTLRWARHAALGQRLHEWAESRGMPLLAPAAAQSPLVSCLQNRLGLDVAALNRYLQPRGLRVGQGVGMLRDRTIRVAHGGELQLHDLEALLNAFDSFLTQ